RGGSWPSRHCSIRSTVKHRLRCVALSCYTLLMSKPMISGGSKATLLERSLRETKTEEITELFLSAAKDPDTWLIGMEIELFGFHKEKLSPLDYPTLVRVLESLGRRWHMHPEYEAGGKMVGLKGHGAIISL